jgi:hypothetical protein
LSHLFRLSPIYGILPGQKAPNWTFGAESSDCRQTITLWNSQHNWPVSRLIATRALKGPPFARTHPIGSSPDLTPRLGLNRTIAFSSVLSDLRRPRRVHPYGSTTMGGTSRISPFYRTSPSPFCGSLREYEVGRKVDSILTVLPMTGISDKSVLVCLSSFAVHAYRPDGGQYANRKVDSMLAKRSAASRTSGLCHPNTLLGVFVG